MKSYTNKQGYILAIIITSIYAFISQENFDFYTFFGNIIGALIIITFLSGFISIFWKFKNFGKVIGIISLIVCSMAFFGNRKYDVEQKEKVEIEQSNLNTINENFKNVYSEFNSKLKTDSRKDILNELILSNKLMFGDINEVSNKLDEVDEYYKWIKTTNDSLFTDLKKQLNEYKEELKDESKRSEIEKNIMKIQISQINASANYVNEMSIIFEMKIILSIKKRCKHKFKNGKILFFETHCLDDWNKAEIKLNESIKNSNSHRENLLNKN
jgi:putative component of toxin-antitoxin plasmid stabilization module